ncbi:MAG: FAD-dependent oxidoreductase [Desulfohalobiaceae bacterium]
MEAISQDSVVSPGDISEAPISMTTTDTNLTGSWKFFRPEPGQRFAPCAAACPLQNQLPKIMQEILQDNWHKALQMLRQSNPLPAVTGRVCPGFCQQSCSRRHWDQEILAGCIERYLGDLGLEEPYPAAQETRKERIAVLGSGPAGLGAAYFLARAGIRVTILEKDKQPGGLLHQGIPAYRLPRDILDKELHNLLQSLNIELQLAQEITPEDIPALLQDYDYVFCAPGLGESVLPAEYQDLKQEVLPGLELLRSLNQGQVPAGKSFAVIGGGNVAVDAARSLLRCGKQVEIIYRRSFQEMPAYPEEKTQALEEGIRLREKRLVSSASRKHDQLRVNLAQAVDKQGSIQPGEEAETLQVDQLVLAVGQKQHMQIPQEHRLFLGGDYPNGPGTVAQALASGRQGAEKILEHIEPGLAREVCLCQEDLPVLESRQSGLEFVPVRPRLQVPELEVSRRTSGFQEIQGSLSQEEVLESASRCLGCGSCNSCGLCWFFCPDVALSLEQGQPLPEIDLQHCKGCGLCAAVCPRGVIQMQEDL